MSKKLVSKKFVTLRLTDATTKSIMARTEKPIGKRIAELYRKGVITFEEFNDLNEKYNTKTADPAKS